MIPYWSLDGSSLYQGNVLDVLDALYEAGIKVHMAATSPPYFGLRSYGLPPVEWLAVSYAPMAGLAPIEVPGCDPGCRHEWGEEQPIAGKVSHGQGGSTLTGGHESWGNREGASQGQWCHLCGGWRGCLGLEPTVEMFVGHIVLIWRELWRVLRDDGTCWLNFGDSYASSGARSNNNGEGKSTMGWPGQRQETLNKAAKMVLPPMSSNLKPKDLIGIPWRVAFALQADGWYLRSDVIWAKGLSFCDSYSGSCMPESVRDRPTNSYEHVFLLAKSKRYYYDGDAVREQWADDRNGRAGGQAQHYNSGRPDGHTRRPIEAPATNGRNLRTVWAINPGSYKGTHFATFSPALVEPMIKAGTSQAGACPSCGAPFERVTEKESRSEYRPMTTGQAKKEALGDMARTTPQGRTCGTVQIQTTGWRPTCTCDAGDPIPCTVLDPFGGSGTTADVARQLGRRWILIELSKEYCDDHIIPRLQEPLIEWAQHQHVPPPEPQQLGFDI